MHKLVQFNVPLTKLISYFPDMSIYQSREVTNNLKISKVLSCRQGGHTWHSTIKVEVNRIKGVKVRAFLHPKINDMYTAKLRITAEISPVLRKQLLECRKQCWVQVDTKVMDKFAGRSLCFVRWRSQTNQLGQGEESERIISRFGVT